MRGCIWLVDDEPQLVVSLVEILSSLRWETRCFYSGREFLDAIAGDPQGIVLLDVHLNDLGAFEVLEGLRSSDYLIPAILMSGGLIEPALRCDPLVTSALTKPFTIAELEAALDNANN